MFVAPNANRPGLKMIAARRRQVAQEVAAAKERSARQAVVRQIAGAK